MRIGCCCEERRTDTEFIAIYRPPGVPHRYLFKRRLHERFWNKSPVLLILMLVKFVSVSFALQKCVVFEVCHSVHEY